MSLEQEMVDERSLMEAEFIDEGVALESETADEGMVIGQGREIRVCL